MESRVRLYDDLIDEDTMGGKGGLMRDWRKALRSRPAYRVVNRTLRNQTQFITLVTVTGFVVLCLLYVLPNRTRTTDSHTIVPTIGEYNSTYPLTKPLITSLSHTFRIGIVADLDTKSKSASDKHKWISYLRRGWLTHSPSTNSITITWDQGASLPLTTTYASKDRGMELSDLVVFNGKLLSFDDRTGMVFHINQTQNTATATPWVLLMDGNGYTSKGFKSEWATVKDQLLYVGSMGKEWTTPSGQFSTADPMWVKVIDVHGRVTHVNWEKEYKRIRQSVDGITWPGYMIHESGAWSSVWKRWFFLPRRCSTQRYNETLDELRGCSYLISTDETMLNIRVQPIANSHSARGFSAFRFIPGTADSVVVALRTEELDGNTATYVTAFRTGDGQVILQDTPIADGIKYEGIEFI